jgi:hypothetical protein
MRDMAAIIGAILLLVGVALVALFGGRRSGSWTTTLGVALAIIGLGIEVIGAVTFA